MSSRFARQVLTMEHKRQRPGEHLLARIEHPRYVAVYDLNSYRAISAVVASETTDDWKGPVEGLVELA